MDDYHEFRREYSVDIELWRQYWSPNYVSITTSLFTGGSAPASSSATVSGAAASVANVNGGVAASGTNSTGGVSTSSGAGVSAPGGVRGAPSGFNPMVEFFHRLKKNYQGVRTDKLKSLQEFQRRAGESLREAVTRMRRLISVTQGVIEAQAVQCWYGILDKELRRRVRDATLLQASAPTLAIVFSLAERIELNIVEERVVTAGFNRDSTPSTSSFSRVQPTIQQRGHRDRSAQP